MQVNCVVPIQVINAIHLNSIMGGIQFFIYEDTPTGRTIIDEKEVSPYQVDETRIVMETSVRILRQNSPNRVFGWYEYIIKNQPNQPGGTQFQ